MSKDDISLAEDYEMVYCGCEYNLGIGWGMTSAINVVESDYVLFLENDFLRVPILAASDALDSIKLKILRSISSIVSRILFILSSSEVML